MYKLLTILFLFSLPAILFSQDCPDDLNHSSQGGDDVELIVYGENGEIDTLICTSPGNSGNISCDLDDLDDSYYLVYTNDDGEECYYDSDGGSIEDPYLPVELIYFKAEYKDNVVLSWATASEINNDYFIIERSYDGYNYEYLANLNGNGNSQKTIKYNYTINENDGTVYYRLTQVDFNGTSETFNPVSVQIISNKKVIKRYSIYGIEVNDDYKGFVIELYNDGTSKKILR